MTRWKSSDPTEYLSSVTQTSETSIPSDGWKYVYSLNKLWLIQQYCYDYNVLEKEKRNF